MHQTLVALFFLKDTTSLTFCESQLFDRFQQVYEKKSELEKVGELATIIIVLHSLKSRHYASS